MNGRLWRRITVLQWFLTGKMIQEKEGFSEKPSFSLYGCVRIGVPDGGQDDVKAARLRLAAGLDRLLQAMLYWAGQALPDPAIKVGF